ncbi:BlaR1 family beta-lactam sensor/signal transducer [Blautia sp.]|uniref:Regulatory protein BlaR1 n=1 Tax=Blautia glucerasea TaxID=536633 RepID=A0A6N2V0C2_9FIRM
MLNFEIHFLICNIFISVFIAVIIGLKRLLSKYISAPALYRLWFLLPGLMTVPFLPKNMFSVLQKFSLSSGTHSVFAEKPSLHPFIGSDAAFEKVNDFAVSISDKTPSSLCIFLLGIWISGGAFMCVLTFRSFLRLHALEGSALPLQHQQVQKLYQSCCNEMRIKKEVPVYSTAFLKSPFTTGFLKPRIYLPIHLISDFNPVELRFIFLHELQHCRQKDALISYWMNFICIIYWFNPFVWRALREIQNDREVSCDSKVLHQLEKSDYHAYGNTLINFAEKLSHFPFPYRAGISGSMKQIKHRILNIAHFQKETKASRLGGIFLFIVTASLFLWAVPTLAFSYSPQNRSDLPKNIKRISNLKLSNAFHGYEGSFVLYNSRENSWSVYDPDNARKRISPNSTYKIYDALLGLESGVISPESSVISWNGEACPFEAWEGDQDLNSAIKNSVNWYFQSIDSQLGSDSIKSFLHTIQYGNQQTGSDMDLYWTDSSLKISPLEQVELLKKFNENEFHFSPDNISAVKKALQLSSSDAGNFFGKTGTGRIDNRDVNGWFVGYVETSDNTYYFSVNIKADSNASGSAAAKIAMSVLSDLEMWKQK